MLPIEWLPFAHGLAEPEKHLIINIIKLYFNIYEDKDNEKTKNDPHKWYHISYVA